MKKYLLLLLLTSCTTPQTILKDKEGHYVSCGGSSVGSVTGGYIGYSIQKNEDQKCIQDYKSKGYGIVSAEENK